MIFCMLLAALAAPAQASQEAVVHQARQDAAALTAELRELLSEELQRGGYGGAVQACSRLAQETTERLAARTGRSIRRVSLRYRNPKDAPDAFEARKLEEFARLPKPPEEHWEVVGGELRYLKTIVVQPMCLGCHGTQIAPEVRQALQATYPQDRATGYQAGDFRGFVSVRAPAGETVSSPALYADLWIQTSAEYEAMCRQIYAAALRELLPAVRKRRSGKPPAVVMDLDETVIDNRGYQTLLHRQRRDHSREAWDAWVRAQAEQSLARCVPGACEFIARIRALGVTPVYVSNRSEETRKYTAAVLDQLGVPSPHMLLKTGGSSKRDRLLAAARDFEVIAWFGDNLSDFSPEFDAAEAGSATERRRRAAAYSDRWGKSWFVLPNPAYGGWLEVLRERPLERYLSER